MVGDDRTKEGESGAKMGGERVETEEERSVATPATPFGRKGMKSVRVDDGNPWKNRTEGYGEELGVLEIVKMAFMVLSGIAIVRIVLFVLVTLVTCIYLLLVLCGHRALTEDGRPVPLSGCRRALLLPVHWGCRVLLWCLGYVWISETYPDGRCHSGYLRRADVSRVVVANHVSMVDALLMGSYFLPVVVTNYSTINYPIVGPAIAALGPILIPRTPEQKAMLPSAAEQLRRRPVEDDPALFPPTLIFPEGTTTNTEYILQFQRGAFLAGVPVQPVCLKYEWSHVDPSWTPDSGGTLWLLFRLICQPINFVHVNFLEPIGPQQVLEAVERGEGVGLEVRVGDEEADEGGEGEKVDPELFGKVVRAKMADVLQTNTLELSDHDSGLIQGLWYGHGREVALYAIKHLLRAQVEERGQGGEGAGETPVLRRMTTSGTISTRRAEQIARLNVTATVALATAFDYADKNRDGVLREEEFARVMDSYLQPASAKAVFRLIDRDADGVIEYKDLLAFFGDLVVADLDVATVASQGFSERSSGQEDSDEGVAGGEEKGRELAMETGELIAAAATKSREEDRKEEVAADSIEAAEQTAAAATITPKDKQSAKDEEEGGGGGGGGGGEGGEGTPSTTEEPAPLRPMVSEEGGDGAGAAAAGEEGPDIEMTQEQMRERLAFSVYDRDGDGFVTVGEIVDTIEAVEKSKEAAKARRSRRRRHHHPEESDEEEKETEEQRRERITKTVERMFASASLAGTSRLDLDGFRKLMYAGEESFTTLVSAVLEGILIAANIDPEKVRRRK